MSKIKFDKIELQTSSSWTGVNSRKFTYWVDLQSPDFDTKEEAKVWIKQLKAKLRGGK